MLIFVEHVHEWRDCSTQMLLCLHNVVRCVNLFENVWFVSRIAMTSPVFVYEQMKSMHSLYIVGTNAVLYLIYHYLCLHIFEEMQVQCMLKVILAKNIIL